MGNRETVKGSNTTVTDMQSPKLKFSTYHTLSQKTSGFQNINIRNLHALQLELDYVRCEIDT